jgi:hypothetical protein
MFSGRVSCAFALPSTRSLARKNPLTPIIPALTTNSPLSPIIPAHTHTPGGGGSEQPAQPPLKSILTKSPAQPSTPSQKQPRALLPRHVSSPVFIPFNFQPLRSLATARARSHHPPRHSLLSLAQSSREGLALSSREGPLPSSLTMARPRTKMASFRSAPQGNGISGRNHT